MKHNRKLSGTGVIRSVEYVSVLSLLATACICALSMSALEVFGQEAKPTSPGGQDMQALTEEVTQGALRIVKPDGQVVECPLKHTDVQAEVSGFIARVKVKQTFYNPLDEKIEAVYVFPLPHKAAVDDMTMVIGQRRIVGLIKRRAEARRIYEEALTQGATAALLEQERPNIFTQSVGNIKPKQEVLIEISYVDVLEYDMGVYTFNFPMVVGPRYIPGQPTTQIPPLPEELKGKVGELDKSKIPQGPDQPKGTGWAPDTDRVSDASRITPPVLKPGYRNGHDISLSLTLDAGVPVQDLKVTNHKAQIKNTGPSKAQVKLSPEDSVPNKDFVLKYAVVGKKPEIAVLTHTDNGGNGYFMLMVQPKEDERLLNSPPREIVFLVDVSGSMSGQPTAKVREAMAEFIKLCKPNDTMQVITFAGQANKLFNGPVEVNPKNTNTALDFTRGLEGSGGTEMLKGIKMAINQPLDAERLRIVIMLSDGYIGNEAEIISEVGRRCGDQIRFWCVGIGSSPNQFLLDGVARQGGGMSKVLGLNDEVGPLVQEVMYRIHRAQLAKINIDWGSLKVFETYPAKIPELWAGRPVVLFGRCHPGAQSQIRISGLAEGQSVTWSLNVEFPAAVPEHDVLAKVWARNKIEELMQQTFYAGSPEVEELVTDVALQYRLMSQYTSFVAVDESEIGKLTESARPPRRMLVPVPLPEGTRYEGFFGSPGEMQFAEKYDSVSAVKELPYMKLWAQGEFRAGEGPLGSRAMQPGFAASAPAPLASRVAGPSPAREYAPLEDSLRLSPAFAPPASWGSSSSFLSGRLSGYAFDAERGGGATYQALQANVEECAKLAQAALKKARELQEQGDLIAARGVFAHAYLLDMAGDGSCGQQALEAVEKINQTLLESWAKDLPKLKQRLNLVIRDKPLGEALEEFGQAAGLKIKLLPGSLQDAATITKTDEVRISYLDLRNATAAQGLDWMLRPVRMTWWVQADTVMVATSRRSSAPSPWVYDVSLVALPAEDELGGKDYQKTVESAKRAAGQFLTAVTDALGRADTQITWYAPGHLLIFGDPTMHERADKLFADLANPDARLAGQLAELHKITSKRAQDRKDSVAKLQKAHRQMRLYWSLSNNSWRLLAGAAAGELDLEALTELQIAWRQPELAEFQKGPEALAVWRSMWVIGKSSGALPQEKELKALAQTARGMCQPIAEQALAALKQSPGDPAAYLSVLYAALAMRDQGDFRVQAEPLLTASGKEESAIAPLRKLAAALIAPAGPDSRKQLIEMISAGLNGEDMVVLTALACRRSGQDAWTTFRAEARNILGRQPLSPSVVILVNNLSQPDLRLAAASPQKVQLRQ